MPVIFNLIREKSRLLFYTLVMLPQDNGAEQQPANGHFDEQNKQNQGKQIESKPENPSVTTPCEPVVCEPVVTDRSRRSDIPPATGRHTAASGTYKEYNIEDKYFKDKEEKEGVMKNYFSGKENNPSVQWVHSAGGSDSYGNAKDYKDCKERKNGDSKNEPYLDPRTVMVQINLLRKREEELKEEMAGLKCDGKFLNDNDRKKYFELKEVKNQVIRKLNLLYRTVGLEVMVRNVPEPAQNPAPPR